MSWADQYNQYSDAYRQKNGLPPLNRTPVKLPQVIQPHAHLE